MTPALIRPAGPRPPPLPNVPRVTRAAKEFKYSLPDGEIAVPPPDTLQVGRDSLPHGSGNKIINYQPYGNSAQYRPEEERHRPDREKEGIQIINQAEQTVNTEIALQPPPEWR